MTPKPGEGTAHGYVFSKTFDKTGKVPTTLVVLTKLGVEYQFTIAMKKGEERGTTGAGSGCCCSLSGNCSKGNSVWVQTVSPQSKVITAIEPYVDPQIGKFVGKPGDTTEIDGHKVPSADVEIDGGKKVTHCWCQEGAGHGVCP